jgi:protein O-mannosyl-transferase
MMNDLSRARLASAAVFLAALAVYANSLFNGFAYDDVAIIQNNARVHQLADQAAIWLTPYWPTAGEQFGLYRPLAIFAYALQWQIGGGEAWPFHLVNVLMHAGVSLLVMRLLLFFVPLGAAALGALAFAVHPVHTEAVANIVGQAELIAALATVGACVLHARRPAGTDVSWPLRVAHVTLFLVAVLTKESAIALPALLVVIDVAQRRFAWTRAGVWGYVRSMGMLAFLIAAAAAAYLIARLDVLGSLRGSDAGPSLPYLKEEFRLLTAFRAWPEFARLMFFPLDLSAEYGPAVILPMTQVTPMVVLGMLLLAATLVCTLMLPHAPLLGLPAAWFLLSVITVSNIFFPIGVLVAERTLYTPSIAVAFIVAAAAIHVARVRVTRTRRLVAAVACVVLVLLGARTWVRNPDWMDTPTVLQSMLRDRPEAYRPYWAWAAILTHQQRLHEAEPYWRMAYRLWPREPGMLSGFGAFLNATDRPAEALPLLQQAVEQTPWAAEPHYYLAEAYLALGQPDEAIAALQRAQRRGPIEPRTLYAQLARGYEGRGDFDRAVAGWRIAVRQPNGDFWLLHALHARAAAWRGLPDEAARAADRAVAVAGNDAEHTAATAVRTLVRDGCYREGRADGCVDPLAGWPFMGEWIPKQPAKISHSARPVGAPGSPEDPPGSL